MAPQSWSPAFAPDAADDRVRAVSDDLELIFAGSPLPGAAVRSRAPSQPETDDRRREQLRSQVARYAAVSAAAILGLAIGVIARTGVEPRIVSGHEPVPVVAAAAPVLVAEPDRPLSVRLGLRPLL